SKDDEGNKVKEVKDGMDITLCAYDSKTQTLEFSGAYNPLYHVRNGQLTEYKADKFPIGKSAIHSGESEFTNQIIKIEKGDMVYLFSDGYADQIGGPNKKKFYYSPFKQLLAANSTLSMDVQRDILDKNITDWIHDRDQVDDIIVMGVKF
ncbi:MAG: SpoIIE family protein phosphatase, partial [Bacteroidetes bacterium]|nr:SpoIIE family protein phosphatase [Bacteroidota bacterium]